MVTESEPRGSAGILQPCAVLRPHGQRLLRVFPARRTLHSPPHPTAPHRFSHPPRRGWALRRAPRTAWLGRVSPTALKLVSQLTSPWSFHLQRDTRGTRPAGRRAAGTGTLGSPPGCPCLAVHREAGALCSNDQVLPVTCVTLLSPTAPGSLPHLLQHRVSRVSCTACCPADPLVTKPPGNLLFTTALGPSKSKTSEENGSFSPV